MAINDITVVGNHHHVLCVSRVKLSNINLVAALQKVRFSPFLPVAKCEETHHTS